MGVMMKSKWRYGLIAMLAVVVLGGGLAGTIMSLVEQPAYTVVQSFGDVEVRDYPAMIVAEVEVAGERKSAINAGFRLIADYIFGNNSPATKIPMTAPVTQQVGEEIAMTAPVSQQSVGGLWTVRFVMPSRYSLEALPKPNNPSVKLVSLPAERFAAIRFSGLADDEALARYKQRLLNRISEERLATEGEAIMAFYNPPWTLPFLRRNEILVKLKQGE
jgi:effector-binding domain-containing protein